jgi:NitT/TauT family transport system ATP-binding protein
MIKIESLSKSYESSLILDNISLEINNGEFVSILGTFGCGKTTLMKIIGGVINDYDGIVLIDGVKPSKILKKRKIGFCFQKANLLPWRNVINNISLPLDLNMDKDSIDKAKKLLELVELTDIEKKNIWEISGGTQQLVSILRSLSLNPDILLLDEPFSSIDEISRDKLHYKLIKIHKKTKKTIVMVTHSISEAVFLSDKIIILSKNPARIIKIVNISFLKRDESIKKTKSYLSYINNIKILLKG